MSKDKGVGISGEGELGTCIYHLTTSLHTALSEMEGPLRHLRDSKAHSTLIPLHSDVEAKTLLKCLKSPLTRPL